VQFGSGQCVKTPNGYSSNPGGRSTTAASTTYRQLLGNPNYLRVFVAGLGSSAGSAISGVCLVWIVYFSTSSALDVGLLGTSYLAAATVFSIFGGTLVDRYDRRRLMILSDVARAIAMALVVLALVLRGFDLLTIFGAYAVVAAFTTVFNPAEQSIVPALVSPGLIADANGLIRSTRSALTFVGASVGGVLIVTLGPVLGVALNAVTFGISAALLLGMTISSAPRVSGSSAGRTPSYFADLAEGFAWLRRARGFLQLTISATFFNFCMGVVETFLVVFATTVLKGSALVYALLLAVYVAGNGVGSLLVSRLQAVRWAGRAWTIPYGVMSGSVALALALFPSTTFALVALFVLGTLGGFAGTAWLSAAQLLVPGEMQGRYFGIDSFGSIAIIPAAQIGGAFLIAAYGVRDTYLLAAAVWVVAGAVFLLPRALWNLGYRPSKAAVADPRDGRTETTTR
jgi:MFS family permease